MNNQKPEAAAKGDGNKLDFHSMFYTIQGEGPFSGHRAIFVRLAGCNLQCPGCDTEYTNGRTWVRTDELARSVNELATQNNALGCLVVITGGEPLRQSIGLLCTMLLLTGFKVQIESNGVLPPDEHLDDLLGIARWYQKLVLVVSPKTSRIHARTAKLADCFKYVLDHRSVDPNDGLPVKALEHPASTGVARPPQAYDGPVYLNPFDAGEPAANQLNLSVAAESAMRHGYILGVQLHKIVGLA